MNDSTTSRWAIALTASVALAVAMGVGRFAFTPLLPMMLADGVVDLHGASWLASANYVGYLLGALLCALQPWIWRRARWLPPVDAPQVVRGGLAATVVLTFGMAVPLPASWPVLRFAAGVASALVLIYTSSWCMSMLARRGSMALGGVMFTGPGAGIVLSGLLTSAMVAAHSSAMAGWLALGVLASALSVSAWRVLGRSVQSSAAAPADASNPGKASDPPLPHALMRHPPARGAEVACLAFVYGLAGFGYIISATFLPVIARTALPSSPWLDFIWPMFGVGIVCGALLATWLRPGGDLRGPLVAAYLVQAFGVSVCVWSPTLAGFAVSSLLLGLPFTAISFMAMQEVRRLQSDAASGMGLLTTLYGIGQIVGPPLVALLLRKLGSSNAGFTLSLELASSALVCGGLMFLAMRFVFPYAAPVASQG